MSDCKYCGQPAGLFHSQHKECGEIHQEGLARISSEVSTALDAGVPGADLGATIAAIQGRLFVSEAEKKDLLISEWSKSVEQHLQNGVIDDEEQARLTAVREQFNLSKEDLNRNGAFSRAVKSSILRQIMRGNIPDQSKAAATLPLNFQKGEQVAWIFQNTRYLEDRTRRTYEGRSAGVSVRIMKGVYYHTAAFHGHPVEHTDRVSVDTGLFVATNSNLYFAGSVKSLRIPYPKIVSFQPFTDGVGLMRDAASAKPQIFVTGDGWFAYNLVTNLSRM
jgi:hypothetical protein